jgi:hypothetical protein
MPGLIALLAVSLPAGELSPFKLLFVAKVVATSFQTCGHYEAL